MRRLTFLFSSTAGKLWIIAGCPSKWNRRSDSSSRQLSGTLTFTVTETMENSIYMALKYAVGVFVFIWWPIDPLVNVSIGLLNYLKDIFISFHKLLLKTISCLLYKHILKAYLVSNPQIKTHSKIFCLLLEWGKIFLSRKKNVGKFQVILLDSNLENAQAVRRNTTWRAKRYWEGSDGIDSKFWQCRCLQKMHTSEI